MANARDNIIDTMSTLLELQGYHATGLNQIIAESGAPKGSLYYYFPEGKEAMAVAVIERIAAENGQRIRRELARHGGAAPAFGAFLRGVAAAIAASGCRGGGPLTTVALETAAHSERLRLACAAAYADWHTAFAEKLGASGVATERAASLATLILSGIEGAIILCRTHKTPAPMEQFAFEIERLLGVVSA